MTDRDKLTKQTEKGRTAELLKSELNEAFSALEEQCFEKFKESSIHDNEGHMAVRVYLKVLEDVKDRFELSMVNGNIARKELVSLREDND